MSNKIDLLSGDALYTLGEKLRETIKLSIEKPLKEAISKITYISVSNDEVRSLLNDIVVDSIREMMANGYITIELSMEGTPSFIFSMEGYEDFDFYYGVDAFVKSSLAMMHPEEGEEIAKTLRDMADFFERSGLNSAGCATEAAMKTWQPHPWQPGKLLWHRGNDHLTGEEMCDLINQAKRLTTAPVFFDFSYGDPPFTAINPSDITLDPSTGVINLFIE